MTSVPAHSAATTPANVHDITIDDLRCEFGERWEITAITGGYRAMPRDSGGHTPIPRYGRTLAELAESIRYLEPRP